MLRPELLEDSASISVLLQPSVVASVFCLLAIEAVDCPVV